MLLVFSPLVISSCTLNRFSSEDFVPASNSSQTTYPEIKFSITAAEFIDEQGHLKVHYNCNYSSPYNVANHEFDRLQIMGILVTENNNSTQEQKYFTVLSPIVQKSLKFEFFDKQGNLYISARFNDVSLYGEDPIDELIEYPEGYDTLYWSDEFNDSTLNQSYWTYEIGDGSPNTGWGNNEKQYYTNSNDLVNDGVLTIQAKKQDVGGYHYTSTRIKTQNKVKFTYGYVEAKIQLPQGNGLWPAFWMMPNNSVYGGWPNSGEIDIMEARGRLINESSSALHFSFPSGGHTYLSDKKTGHNITQYHKYAVEWLQDSISFYVDDYCYLSYNKNQWSTSGATSSDTAPFDQDFYIILNLAVGGNFDGGILPPDSSLPAEMKVDYVRVFK